MPDDADSEGGSAFPLLMSALQNGSWVTRHRRIKLAFLASCLICWGLLAVLIVAAALLSSSLLIVGSGPQEPVFITMAVNGTGVKLCQKRTASLPCMANNVSMVTNDTSSLGPLYFTSDSVTYQSSVGNCANCPRFQLTTDRLGVVIPVSGVYRAFSQVVFHDPVDAYVGASVQIRPIEGQQGGSFKWLSCLTHHKKSDKAELTQCTVDGVRRFHAGDVVSFVVHGDFRKISVKPSCTHFYIHKL